MSGITPYINLFKNRLSYYYKNDISDKKDKLVEFFKNHIQEHIPTVLALGSIVGGYKKYDPFFMTAGSGYINYQFLNLLEFTHDPFQNFQIRQSAFYSKYIEPYTPNFFNSFISFIEKHVGWKDMLFATEIVAYSSICGLFLGTTFAVTSILAKLISNSLYTSKDGIAYRINLLKKKLLENVKPKSDKKIIEPITENYKYLESDQTSRDEIAKRKNIANQNNKLCPLKKDGPFDLDNISVKDFKKMLDQTCVVKSDEDIKALQAKLRVTSSDISITDNVLMLTNQDYIDAYVEASQKGYKVAIVNCANPEVVGGAYEEGLDGYEEELLRRAPDAYFVLKHIYERDFLERSDKRLFYHSLDRQGCIYIPQVLIKRRGSCNNRAYDYSVMENQIPVDIISSAPPILNSKLDGFKEDQKTMAILGFMKNLNSLKDDIKQRINKAVFDFDGKSIIDYKQHGITFDDFIKLLDEKLPPDLRHIVRQSSKATNTSRKIDINTDVLSKEGFEEFTKEKIRLQLRVAIKTDHDTLIIPAWGCKFFGNDPKEIARLYKEVYKEEEFFCKIRLIFAIPEDMYSTRANFELSLFDKPKSFLSSSKPDPSIYLPKPFQPLYPNYDSLPSEASELKLEPRKYPKWNELIPPEAVVQPQKRDIGLRHPETIIGGQRRKSQAFQLYGKIKRPI